MYESEQTQTSQDWERRRRLRVKRAKMRRKQQRKQMLILIAAAVVLALVLLFVGIWNIGDRGNTTETEPTAESTTPVTNPEPTNPLVAWMSFEQGRQITASQYFVYDVEADTFPIISGAPTQTVYPGSVSQLLTAYLALQHVDPAALITAGDALNLVTADSPVAGIQPADQFNAGTLVEAMLLSNSSDAACLLAVEAGRIMSGDSDLSADVSADLFMTDLNHQAEVLGMTGTHFVTPDGIHQDDHYTTIQDLTVLTKLALENSTIRKYALVSRASVPLESGRELQWKNTNALIDPNSDYYCNCAIGLKTGSIPQVGSCLLSAFEYNGRTMIVGVFGCASDEDRFMDTLHLFNEAMGFTDTM